MPFLVYRLKISPVKLEVRFILTRQHCIRLCAGSNENRLRRKYNLLAARNQLTGSFVQALLLKPQR